MNELPSISNYGNYSTENYGFNTLRVDIGDITLWYSYRTIVAFRTWSTGLVISENVWSVTTGKHLNWINDDHSIRIPYDQFEQQLREELDRRSKADQAIQELIPVLKDFLDHKPGSMGKLKNLARKLVYSG